jgi:hypothetical protein
MKGDFSRLRFSPELNFNGILPQQGKVLLDSDGIAQTLIANNWRTTAARDVMGAGAMVPAEFADSFKVTAASLAGGVVTLTVDDGHLWADGLLVRLVNAAGSSNRTATWLEPPIVATAGGAADVAAGTTDAVILEVWQHAVNGFQIPEALIEPALGGPDTAGRLQTSFAFRLARLSAGQTCGDLNYDESGRGALTASLVPPVVIAGDCPVQGAGGYSGYEHQLYRIEIADSNLAASQFKWSRSNAGLVGRGNFDPATRKIAISANLAAITSANQTSFYLEIESYDPALGFSRVVAGATVTLSGNVLQCPATTAFGAYPSAAGAQFFRLWDGLAPVSSFPISGTPNPLESGILLQFDADGPGKYFPGDYWTFPVRAQGIPNPQTLINASKPFGIVYHRVALAEITWSGAGGSFTGTIEDCRSIVPPLSRAKGCCTYRVGDGITSFGDFTSIQDAVDELPFEGGEVCILPGHYFERVLIHNRRDVVIHGCGWQTRVSSPAVIIEAGEGSAGAGPNTAGNQGAINPFGAVFTIVASQHVKLCSFAIEAADGDVGVLIDGFGTSQSPAVVSMLARAAVQLRADIDIALEDLVITASTMPAILAERVQLLRVARNRIAMQNTRSLWPAVFAVGNEIHIERNWVGIHTPASMLEWLPFTVTTDLGAAAGSGNTSSTNINAGKAPQILHPGGIQIGGPSTDVYLIENEIDSGSRNGITLGSFAIIDANGNDTGVWTGVAVTTEGDDCCTGTLQPPGTTPPGGGQVVSAGILINIHIHRNRIRDMGLCGIGPVALFDLREVSEIISIIGLHISANEISRTLLRDLDPVSSTANASIGYGAICIPDVRDLTIRDNAITDFGALPGVDVCGIFILYGESIEISRNHVLETRDWAAVSKDANTSIGGVRGGIMILGGSPPSFGQPVNGAAWGGASKPTSSGNIVITQPLYEPGLPAVTVANNIVRVPENYALALFGFGPFEITGNHFGCGGQVRTAAVSLAQTVLILNTGTSLESAAAATPTKTFNGAQLSNRGIDAAAAKSVAAGSVLFTSNVCQLETRASGQREDSSVLIFTPDHLIFNNNHCWLDSVRLSAIVDALLIAGSLNVIGNRFQESPNSVVFSGITAGGVNITGQNISTYCLIALGTLLLNNNNIAIVQGSNTDLCAGLWKRVAAEMGL